MSKVRQLQDILPKEQRVQIETGTSNPNLILQESSRNAELHDHT